MMYTRQYTVPTSSQSANQNLYTSVPNTTETSPHTGQIDLYCDTIPRYYIIMTGPFGVDLGIRVRDTLIECGVDAKNCNLSLLNNSTTVLKIYSVRPVTKTISKMFLIRPDDFDGDGTSVSEIVRFVMED